MHPDMQLTGQDYLGGFVVIGAVILAGWLWAVLFHRKEKAK